MLNTLYAVNPSTGTQAVDPLLFIILGVCAVLVVGALVLPMFKKR